jgi:hypothetical protein
MMDMRALQKQRAKKDKKQAHRELLEAREYEYGLLT